MKYILIRGASHSGKSTTMNAICKALQPDRIQRLNVSAKTSEDVNGFENVLNGSFILEVHGIIILLAAGATTEQGINITLLVKIVIELKGRVDFAIVSMRSYETKEGFSTPDELILLGECIYEETLRKIPGDDFQDTAIWHKRMAGILGALRTHGVAVPALSNEFVA